MKWLEVTCDENERPYVREAARNIAARHLSGSDAAEEFMQWLAHQYDQKLIDEREGGSIAFVLHEQVSLGELAANVHDRLNGKKKVAPVAGDSEWWKFVKDCRKHMERNPSDAIHWRQLCPDALVKKWWREEN